MSRSAVAQSGKVELCGWASLSRIILKNFRCYSSPPSQFIANQSGMVAVPLLCHGPNLLIFAPLISLILGLIVLYLSHIFTLIAALEPDFTGPLMNISVAVGRDATFSCGVKFLGGYRVSVSIIPVLTLERLLYWFPLRLWKKNFYWSKLNRRNWHFLCQHRFYTSVATPLFSVIHNDSKVLM